MIELEDRCAEGATRLDVAEGLLQGRKLRDALVAFDEAQGMGIAAHLCAGGRWMAAMLQGDFCAAWRESDAIRRLDFADPHRFWTGEDLSGKRLIVRCLHGLGDTVQFLQYAPRLKEATKQLTIEVAPRFLPLAPCFEGVTDVVTWGAEAPLIPPVWDAQVELMELPYILRTELAELPIATRYLHVPEDVMCRVKALMGDGVRPRVGLAWRAGEWDPERCLPLSKAVSLLRDNGAEFWSLQEGNVTHEAMKLEGFEEMRDSTVCGDGVLPLAAVISNLDIVITVDTLAAHLAGALGKRAWVLLQHAADWRWMIGRTDSPWYPTLRLFRQPAQGDWDSVVEEVKTELSRFTRSFRRI